ncbi:hypothetical protein POTOM_001634 [Populus tomentosa]|uniref:Uncharacterized protein n=1 Tax=Populus tomentosa TaxID=118781 RepID=A0A8X8IYW4_POPTO|nr:hypothetical protein POTOM_001634 [Populus tomentosa]
MDPPLLFFPLLCALSPKWVIFSRAIIEVKPLLIGIHERVKSDIVAHEPSPSVPSTIDEGGKRVPTVTNPSVEDVSSKHYRGGRKACANYYQS